MRLLFLKNVPSFAACFYVRWWLVRIKYLSSDGLFEIDVLIHHDQKITILKGLKEMGAKWLTKIWTLQK